MRALRTGFIERDDRDDRGNRENKEFNEFKELRERLSLISLSSLISLNSLIDHLNQQDKFVVRRAPSATLGKNGDDG